MLAVAGCSSPDAGDTQSRTIAEPVAFPVPSASTLLVEGLAQTMSDAELVGQLLMVSLEQTADGAPPATMSREWIDLIETVKPGGIILFASNIDQISQVQTLVDGLQAASGIPLIIATDHEGGNVSRLKGPEMPATVMPSATLVGIAAEVLAGRDDGSDPSRLARNWGEVIGRELRSLGITMNMAPVADVGAEGPAGLLSVQRRTFGSDPELVSALVAASLQGMHDAGVTGVLKHFPGQGAAEADSHTTAVVLERTREQLYSVDLTPFVAGIEAGARAIMSAHISYPLVTDSTDPATVSPAILTDLLRGELGFRGVIITDALNMDGVAATRPDLELARAAIDAGADILLKPPEPLEIHASLVEMVKSGIVPRDRLEGSVRRILEIKLTSGLLGPAPRWSNSRAGDILGADEHQAVVDEIRAIARSGR